MHIWKDRFKDEIKKYSNKKLYEEFLKEVMVRDYSIFETRWELDYLKNEIECRLKDWLNE